jgi:hypothetical protein
MKIMLCKNCNFENDSTARFCENCGAGLQESPARANKGLTKVIMGSIVLLYVLVIAVFWTGQISHSCDDYYDRIRQNSYWHDSVSESQRNEAVNNAHQSYWQARSICETVMILLSLLASCVLVALVVLLILRKIKRAFGITAILLCIYAAIGISSAVEGVGVIMLIVTFFAAITTTLIYKYSFAPDQKLL